MFKRTLILIKPDWVQNKIVGNIISRFENINQFTIKGIKFVKPSWDLLYKHYETIGKLKTRTDEVIFSKVIRIMQEWPIVAIVLEGDEHIQEQVRKMIWCTEPLKALPGTIRGDYSADSFEQSSEERRAIRNIIHASANAEEARDEIDLWFTKDEII